MAIPQKVKQEVKPHNLEILLLVIYPREMKTNVYTKTCTLMFRAALFIRVKKWEKLKCPLTDEWINKMWYNHRKEYYLVIKGNEVLIHDLENIMLHENNQAQKATYCIMPFV